MRMASLSPQRSQRAKPNGGLSPRLSRGVRCMPPRIFASFPYWLRWVAEALLRLEAKSFRVIRRGSPFMAGLRHITSDKGADFVRETDECCSLSDQTTRSRPMPASAKTLRSWRKAIRPLPRSNHRPVPTLGAQSAGADCRLANAWLALGDE